MNCKFLRGSHENRASGDCYTNWRAWQTRCLVQLRNKLCEERDRKLRRSSSCWGRRYPRALGGNWTAARGGRLGRAKADEFGPFRDHGPRMRRPAFVHLSESAPRLNCHLSVAAHAAGAAAAMLAFSFVPDSGTSAAASSPSLTLGTVACTSVIGRPWVGAIVLTPSRSINWSSRSQ
jgi:hypothetical protein